MYHTHRQSNSFSMVFSMANGQYRGFDEGEMYSFAAASPSAASVDCTLSLGTPSTRHVVSNDHQNNVVNNHHQKKNRSSCMSNFGWNILPSKHTPPPPPTPSSASRSHRGGSNAGGDPLLARRCANCDTTSTPLWRNGPRGPKSLCNACGIRFKKEERRAAASGAAGGHAVDTQHEQYMMKTPPACHGHGNELIRFVEDDVVVDHHHYRDSETMQFLSWRFNAAGPCA